MYKYLKGEKIQRENVILSLDDVGLDGELHIPQGAHSIVMFVHGSGSDRFSSRNRYLAEELNKCGHATLLLDLFTAEEEELDRRSMLCSDIDFLARRVLEASKWLREYGDTENLRLCYFAASTGAAAALVAAAAQPRPVHAIVCRGGRPDLAKRALNKVKAPTLLIVGGKDKEGLRFNREALLQLNCENHLEVVPDATHLFEEEGALESVAQLAASWFSWYAER